jgi:pentatricopeptide repeat protein
MGGDRTGLGSIKGDPLQQALAVWARMQACGVPPSAYTYGALLSACARWRGWREACHVMEQMRARGQPPLASHYEAALRACARAAGRTGTGGLQLGTPEGPMAAVLELAKQAEADGVSVPKATARARHAVVTVLDAHLLMAAGMAGVRSAEL